MDTAATEKASRRLNIAQKAHRQLGESSDHDEFSDHWYTLITAAKNVWTILEQGAKSSPQSRQWFGAKKRQRREDELLQYMFEARNCDEHGLEKVVLPQSPYNALVGRFAVGETPRLREGTMIDGIGINQIDGGMVVHGVDPDGHKISFPVPSQLIDYPATSRLASIKDRGGNVLRPPTNHLGKLVDDHPTNVADLALKYLQKLIDEAKTLHMPSL